MTTPVTAVIVDDEPAAREAIRTLLRPEPRIEILGEASDGDQAVDLIRATRPDLVFLDVQMPNRDGFAVLDALGADVPRGVIFVTAYDEHALRAFDVHALDYLLKPFGRPRFAAAVARAVERLDALEALSLRPTVDSILAARAADQAQSVPLPAVGRGISRFGIRIGARTVVVDLDQVDWLEALGDYVRLHAGHDLHLVSQSLAAIEAGLDPDQFLRIHRGTIVRLSRIRELLRDPDGAGTAILADGVRLRVARGRWSILEAALKLERG